MKYSSNFSDKDSIKKSALDIFLGGMGPPTNPLPNKSDSLKK